jgi:FAD/FMN-containing dehydrogenase
VGRQLNAERKARVVALVKDTGDIGIALKYVRANDLQVGIRCGSHSPSGASSAEDGLIIDLSRYFNYAVVDPERHAARAVGGCFLCRTVENESYRVRIGQ